MGNTVSSSSPETSRNEEVDPVILNFDSPEQVFYGTVVDIVQNRCWCGNVRTWKPAPAVPFRVSSAECQKVICILACSDLHCLHGHTHLFLFVLFVLRKC